MYQRFGKRALDILVSTVSLILFWPLIAFIALLVRIKLGSPVLFKQDRPGKNEKIFTLKKFRTMTNSTDEHGNLISDEERLTSFGNFLRKTSLDELPELFNIFKGEMSIVGPRPLLVEYLPMYNEEQRKRHRVRPGLTGLAQVNGRNAITWEEKFKWDVKYLENITLLNDLRIVIATFLIVINREGVSSTDHVSMPKFTKNMNAKE